jgi:D-aminopeptidase
MADENHTQVRIHVYHKSAQSGRIKSMIKTVRRAREIGWIISSLLETGPANAITDLAGVLVGHCTLVEGEAGPLEIGLGPVRTGVTAIRPHPGNLFTHPVRAAVYVLNGYGKTVGLEQVRELGRLETPILLTNTLNTWRCADYLLDWMLQENPRIGISRMGTLNPVVGECNDGWLNDIQGRHIRREHVFQALQSAATGVVLEGNIGAGTGTRCYAFKGGIGTASRILPKANGGFTVGVLLQTNFGARQQLILCGRPVGQWYKDWPDRAPDYEDSLIPESGSCVMVLATDAPLSTRQLGRLARRAPLGLARTGFTSNPGSGDYVIAFSTAAIQSPTGVSSVPLIRAHRQDRILSQLFQAVVESTEEAVLNALVAAQTMAGRDGHLAPALPVDELQERFADGRESGS